jgi:hypothetical protein
MPTRLLTQGYLAISAVIVLWDILMTGRIVHLRNRGAKRSFAAFTLITAFAGLLLAPALLVAVTAATTLWGRAIQTIAWVWPFTTLLFAIQALLSLGRGMVSPMFGIPVLAYNTVIAAVAITHYMNSRGLVPPDWLLVMSAAQASALGVVGGLDALWRGLWLQVPLISPAIPSRWRIGTVIRGILAGTVLGLLGFVAIGIPGAYETIESYKAYQRDQLQDRPEGDLDIGLKLFPDIRAGPPPVAIRNDVALVDTLNVDAIEVVVDPDGARGIALDSLARAIDQVRGDSTVLVVALGYPQNARELIRRAPREYMNNRIADVNRLARRLRPNHLIPAVDPYGRGSRELGSQPLPFWIEYFTRAADIAHHVNPNIRVGVSVSSYGTRDSALYAWASSRQSPIDIIGLTLMPGFDGALSLNTYMRIAQRWMRLSREGSKPHWVWSAGGIPIAHGEKSQELAIWGALCWASTQPAIKGFVVRESGDYDTLLGLRASTGRLRSATGVIDRAIKTIRGTTSGP